MCMKKYINYTFSNSEAFFRISEELRADEENTKATINATLFIVIRSDKKVDLDKEPYTNLCEFKDIDMLIEVITLHFSGWGNFCEMVKTVQYEDKHVFGSITLEVR